MTERPGRPLFDLTTRELRGQIEAATKDQDRETFAFSVAEAQHRSEVKGPDLLALEMAAVEQGLVAIPWLETAHAIALDFEAETKGKGRASVYAVLLEPPEYGTKYELYIGETALSPTARFKRHKSGHKASRHVRDRGLCLMPRLFRHLNPMKRHEAREIEATLAEALAENGIPIRGGH